MKLPFRHKSRWDRLRDSTLSATMTPAIKQAEPA